MYGAASNLARPQSSWCLRGRGPRDNIARMELESVGHIGRQAGPADCAWLEHWHCVACSGQLYVRSDDEARCADCGVAYTTVDGIPDLRSTSSRPADASKDLASARALSSEFAATGLEGMVRRFFDRPGWSDATKAMRARQTLESPDKLRPELEGWLRPCLDGDRPFLDVGCGIGGLLAGAARLGHAGIGVDSSMSVLVTAKRMIERYGGKATLACAYAERLPLARESVSGVTMYDVIEHVQDVGAVIAEADRVVRPGGHLAISTPNRYSISAEPHVFLWGVGWLPRRLQEPYVRWRTGRPYHGTRLLSSGELSRQLEQHADLRFELRVPAVPEAEISHFGRRRALLARLYNRIVAMPISRRPLLRIGPFFQVIARRTPVDATRGMRDRIALAILGIGEVLVSALLDGSVMMTCLV